MSDLTTMIVSSITDLTTQANELAGKISAATTDRTKLVHDYLNPEEGAEPADDKIAQFIQMREQVLARLEDEENKAREYVTATYLGDIDESAVDAQKAEYKELADKVKTSRKFFLTTIPGATEDDLKDVPALKTLRGGTASGGSGSKRPRLNRVAYRTSTSEPWTEVSKQTKNAKDEDVTVTNFTVLATELKAKFGTKVEVKDLQSNAFEAAGTDDLSSLEGKVFEFAVTVGEQNVFVQVQPKSDSDE